jgi:hypothetical protein
VRARARVCVCVCVCVLCMCVYKYIFILIYLYIYIASSSDALPLNRATRFHNMSVHVSKSHARYYALHRIFPAAVLGDPNQHPYSWKAAMSDLPLPAMPTRPTER